jgi:PAS domain S-box-containing protein
MFEDALKGKTVRVEKHIVLGKSTAFWLDAVCTPVIDADHSVERVVFSYVDITQRKQAEEALQQSEECFKVLFEKNPQPMMVFDRQTLRILTVNTAAIHKYGYSLSQFLGMNMHKLQPSADISELTDRLGSHIINDLGTSGVCQHVKKDGSFIQVQIIYHALVFAEFDAQLAVIQDVTEQKRIEAQLRKAQTDLLEAQAIAKIGSFEFDLATRTAVWTKQAALVFGLPEKTRMQDVKIENIIYEEDRKLAKNCWQRVFRKGKEARMEFRVERKDHSIAYLSSIGKPVFGPDGKVKKMVGTFQDLTERKKSEEEVQINQMRFRHIFEKSPIGILITNEKGIIIQVNAAFCKLLQYNPEELIYQHIADISYPDPAEIELNLQQRRRMFAGEMESFQMEKRYQTKTKEIVWGRVTGTYFKDEKDGALYSMGMVENITHLKAAEDKAKITQARFRTIFEQSPVGFAIMDEKNRLIQVNDTLCNLLGYAAEELKQLTLTDITLSETGISSAHTLESVINGKVSRHSFEDRFLSKTKKIIWGKLTAAGFREEADSRLLIMVIFEDITERKQAEIQLVESESRLREAQEVAQLGSWEVNMLTKESHCSEQFFNIFEITEEADKHRFLADPKRSLQYMHPEDRAKATELMIAAYRCGNDFDIEHRSTTVKGNSIYVRSIGSFKWSPERELIKVYGTIQDITEQKRKEAELIRAKQLAEEAALAKQQFLSVMSHEIRTPMNAVIGLSNILLHDNPRLEQIENLKMLKFSSENLLSLINDILDFSKIEAGKVTFEKVNFCLRDLMLSIIRSLNFKASEKGIKLLSNLDSALPEVICGDPVRLTQILNNLLTNAIKFTEVGKVGVHVSLISEDTQSVCISFEVADTGIGIATDKLDYIFESFSQADSDTTRKFGGTGLGLSITKRLLELQESQICVSSILGEGSKFYFRLQFNKVNESSPSVHADYTIPANTDLSYINLLLVEDNEINQLVASKFLRKWKIQAHIAANGRIAVEKVMENQYDIILMDLQMPEMNGYEATRIIRTMEEEKHRHLAILALTAETINDIQEHALAAGITDFLTKPFNPNELYHKIVKYAGNRLA